MQAEFSDVRLGANKKCFLNDVYALKRYITSNDQGDAPKLRAL